MLNGADQLDYNPFSISNSDRNYFNEIREEFLGKNKRNVVGGSLNYEEWYNQTIKGLIEMLIGRFEWEGLPDNMPKAYIETKLLINGSALIYEHETDGLFVGTGTRSKELNHYGESVGYQVISPMSEHNAYYELDVDGVLVKNKSVIEGDIGLIAQYAHLLTTVRVTQSININQLRTPFMLLANEKTKESIKEQFYQVMKGAPYVIVDPELNETHGHTAENVFSTNAPYNVDLLQQLYNDWENELLTKLGMNNNPSQDKKERLIVDEVASNDQELSANIKTRLDERQRAAKKANELFGTNISVDISEAFMKQQREGNITNVTQHSSSNIEFRKKDQ